MPHIPDENAIPKAVKNEWFYLFARACMILATLVGLPSATWMMSRVIAKADEISAQVSAQNIDLKLLSGRVEFQMQMDKDKLTDHEQRLRMIERLK